jgi:ketosteroid isomerase-like protein
MSENTDALKRGYDAFNRGDVETVSAIFADDIRWEGPNTEGLPMSGVHEGKQAVLEALGRIGGEYFETFRASPDEMVEEGGTVVVLSHLEGRTRSGNDVKLPGVEIWRMGDGIAQRVQSLTDTAEMKQALGG